VLFHNNILLINDNPRNNPIINFSQNDSILLTEFYQQPIYPSLKNITKNNLSSLYCYLRGLYVNKNKLHCFFLLDFILNGSCQPGNGFNFKDIASNATILVIEGYEIVSDTID